jgi:hypothetical protein
MATGRIGTTPVLTTRWSKAPAAGTTSLSGLDDNSVSLVYSVGYEAVYRNGTLLSRGNDYTATNGTTITLVDATLTGDIIEVFANQTVPLTDTYSQTVANSLFVNQATFDAKGDLIAGTADNAYTKLSVGSNGDTLVADSSTSTGLRWNPAVSGGKNFLINGNFDFFQRGSFSQGSAGYALDRWRIDTANTITVTQQTTGAPNGSRYCMRVAFNATTYSDVMQMMETNTVAPLWGNTVTLQIKLRRNSSLTADLSFVIQKSATVDAGAGATWTTIGTANATNAQLPTGTGASNWYLLTLTVSIPNDGTANSLRLIGGVNNSQASGAYWEIAQAQLELGSVATSFSRAGGTLAGELAACQRYYQLVCDGNSQSLVNGCAYTSTSFYGVYNPRTQMRTSPTISATTGTNYYTVYGNNANDACDAITGISGVSPYNVYFYISSGLALTQGYAYWLEATSAATRVALQAEL